MLMRGISLKGARKRSAAWMTTPYDEAFSEASSIADKFMDGEGQKMDKFIEHFGANMEEYMKGYGGKLLK